MWESHPEYWELWYIRAGEVRPTYDGNPKIPSFGPNAAKDDNWDDNYMTGMICDRRFRPRSRTGAITKGWVRFTGKAALYRVVDLQRWDSNWQQKFQTYKARKTTPAGVLPYAARDSRFPAWAMEGREEPHNMVAYWNSCWPLKQDRDNQDTRIKAEPAQAYTAAELWAKVDPSGPRPYRLWPESKENVAQRTPRRRT